MTIRAGALADVTDFTPGVGIGIPAFITKGSAETVTSSTTLQDDDHLTFEMEPGATYVVEVFLNVQSASGTPDFRTAWSVPADATGARWAIGPAVSGSAGFVGREDTNGRFSVHGHATVVSYSLDTAGVAVVETGWIASATGGTFTLQWAQNVSNATATQVNSSSWMRYTRVA